SELQSKRDALKDPFAREAEESVRPRRQMIRAELRKEAAVNGSNIQSAKVPNAPPSKDETPKAAPAPAPSVVPPTKIEDVLDALRGFQQRIGSHDRVRAEREELKKELLAALGGLEKHIDAYATALNQARQLARRHHATAVNLKKRAGRQELADKDLPAGI